MRDAFVASLSHPGSKLAISRYFIASAAFLAVVFFVAKLAVAWAGSRKRRAQKYAYIPYGYELRDVVVTDCTHPKAPTLTHHKGHNNPHGLRASDTSTGIVLNAIQSNFLWGGEAYKYCQNSYISSNHFDVDAFLSVWCYINRDLALKYEPGATPCT